MSITAVRTLGKSMGTTVLWVCIAHHGWSQERSVDYLIDQGQSRQMHGEFAEAERLFLEALGDVERKPGVPLAVPGVLANLAALYSEQARYLDAERLLLRALAIAQRETGFKSISVGRILWRLIGVYADAGHLAQADPLLRQYQAIAELNLDSDPLAVAENLGNVGRIYLARNDSRRALPLFQKAVEIVEAHRSGNDLQFARALLDRASASDNLGHISDALTDVDRAAAIEQGVSDPPSQLEIDLQVTAGLAYAHAGRGAEAETCLNAALRIAEAHYGPNHPVVAQVLRKCDLVLRKFGKKTEASSCRDRARRILAANDRASPLGRSINAFIH